MEDMVFNVTEVSKLIKTNPAYVYRLINSGQLKALKLGSMKVRKSTLEQFLAQNEGMDLTDPFEVKKMELYGDGEEGENEH
jgi:excisionase family DNA binding protein